MHVYYFVVYPCFHGKPPYQPEYHALSFPLSLVLWTTHSHSYVVSVFPPTPFNDVVYTFVTQLESFVPFCIPSCHLLTSKWSLNICVHQGSLFMLWSSTSLVVTVLCTHHLSTTQSSPITLRHPCVSPSQPSPHSESLTTMSLSTISMGLPFQNARSCFCSPASFTSKFKIRPCLG